MILFEKKKMSCDSSIPSPAGHRSAALLGAALFALVLAVGCAGNPRPAPSALPGGTPGRTTDTARSGGGQTAPSVEQPKPAPMSPWLQAALASLSWKDLPGGARLVVRRAPGRPLAAAELCIVGQAGAAKSGDDGALALGLALLSRGKAGDKPGSLVQSITAAGGRLEFKELSYDAIALELVAPPAALPGLLSALTNALAEPAFTGASFPQAEFDAVMKDFRIRRLRESRDPGLRASDRLRSDIYRDHPYSGQPLGTEGSLLSLTCAQVAAAWKAKVGSECIAISVVGDLDADALSLLLAPAFERLGVRGPAPVPAPALPVKDALLFEPMTGAQGAYIRVDFAAPDRASQDYAALSVALAMLDDVLMEELRGKESLAYGAYTRLSFSAAPSASIIVTRAFSAQAAKAAIERSLAVVAGGSCLALDGSGYAPLAAAVGSYRSRTLARLYAGGERAADMAEYLARDLAAGGDGSLWFRMADRINAVRAEDILRIAKASFGSSPKAWAIAAPPELLAPLSK
jgi:predicted Zn-dependent peptidase